MQTRSTEPGLPGFPHKMPNSGPAAVALMAEGRGSCVRVLRRRDARRDVSGQAQNQTLLQPIPSLPRFFCIRVLPKIRVSLSPPLGSRFWRIEFARRRPLAQKSPRLAPQAQAQTASLARSAGEKRPGTGQALRAAATGAPRASAASRLGRRCSRPFWRAQAPRRSAPRRALAAPTAADDALPLAGRPVRHRPLSGPTRAR